MAGATYLMFDEIDWATESTTVTPKELVDAARATGA